MGSYDRVYSPESPDHKNVGRQGIKIRYQLRDCIYILLKC